MKLTRQSAKNATELKIGTRFGLLFSYSTPVAVRINKEFYVTDEFISSTTDRHIEEWLASHNKENVEATEKPQSFFETIIQDYLKPSDAKKEDSE